MMRATILSLTTLLAPSLLPTVTHALPTPSPAAFDVVEERWIPDESGVQNHVARKTHHDMTPVWPIINHSLAFDRTDDDNNNWLFTFAMDQEALLERERQVSQVSALRKDRKGKTNRFELVPMEQDESVYDEGKDENEGLSRLDGRGDQIQQEAEEAKEGTGEGEGSEDGEEGRGLWEHMKMYLNRVLKAKGEERGVEVVMGIRHSWG